MVTKLNVSAYNGQPSSNDKIDGGPCYALCDVQALASSNAIVLATRRSNNQAYDLGFDTADIGTLILELTTRDYKDSEWCDISQPNRVVAADAYTLRRIEHDDTTEKKLYLSYYLKFAISSNNQILMMVSNHLSGRT